MSRRAIEMIEEALKLMSLPQVRKYHAFLCSIVYRERKKCSCDNGPKFCECESCDKHRWESMPLIIKREKVDWNLEDWINTCDCEKCVKHREAEDLFCYDCTTRKELGNWVDGYCDSISQMIFKLEAAKARLENNLKRWVSKKRAEEKGDKEREEDLEPLIYWGED